EDDLVCGDPDRHSIDLALDAKSVAVAVEVDHRALRPNLGTAGFEPPNPAACNARGRRARAGAPDLSARREALVDQHHARAAPCRRRTCGRGDPGWSAADHGDVEHGLSSRPVVTFMPGSTLIMQARWCATPSIVTRHSKQTPMPHTGARASPLGDTR